jgi:hypothetical protein
MNKFLIHDYNPVTQQAADEYAKEFRLQGEAWEEDYT